LAPTHQASGRSHSTRMARRWRSQAAAHAADSALEVEPELRFALSGSDHCNRLRRVTSRRISVRPIGIDLQPRLVRKQANQQPQNARQRGGILGQGAQVLRRMSRRGAARSLRATGSRVGSASVDTTKAVQMRAACRGSSHPQQRGHACRRGRRARSYPASPAADQRSAPGRGERVAPAQDPRQQLPVAARPAMLRAAVRHIATEILNDLDVGDQTGAANIPSKRCGGAACPRYTAASAASKASMYRCPCRHTSLH